MQTHINMLMKAKVIVLQQFIISYSQHRHTHTHAIPTHTPIHKLIKVKRNRPTAK